MEYGQGQQSLDGMLPPQPPMPEPMEAEPIDPQEQAKIEMMRMAEEANVAEGIKKKKNGQEKLDQIGDLCAEGYEADKETVQSWVDMVDEWMKLATQHSELKTYPWPNASNIKYPLVSIAAMQFSARAYPTLVPSDGQVVKAVVIGKDDDGAKLKRAKNVAKFMSWQLTSQMEEWEEEFDRLLVMDAVMGTVFKKTFYDPYLERPVSVLVDPRQLVVNYYAESIDKAERVSQEILLYQREYDERVKMGIFLDVELGAPEKGPETENGPDDDETTPHLFVEQHRWLDLNDDGIEEPWIVTFHRNTKKVVRISARFTEEDLIMRGDKLVRIQPTSYFTKFGFIPNPESRIYDLGFGHLLGPINESVNTIVNQLVDSGTLANLQAGFIGKGLRVKMGDHPLQPGEWRAVNAVGDDIRKQLIPIPAKEPSKTLFELLGMLITSGKELASVAEIFVGKMPGQNTPATTTMATIEQGMKVFTAIYKRLYRSLAKEFKKLYRLNHVFLDPATIVNVLDEPIGPQDFETKSYDICPGADPTAVSQTERLIKAQALLELLPFGVTDPVESIIRVLEAQEQPNWQKLIPGMAQTGQPQIPEKQDPKLQEMQMKMDIEQQKAAMAQQMQAQKLEFDRMSNEQKLAMEKMMAQMDIQKKQMDIQLDAQKAAAMQKIFMAESQQKLMTNEVTNQQKVRHQQEMNKSKLQQQSGKSGGAPKQGRPSRKGSSKG